jgi:hypothetical protein
LKWLAGRVPQATRRAFSLYARAVGYNYEAMKIFMPANRSKPVYAKYVEHVLGKYIISDQPMTEEQWARERADVIDAEPTGNGREAVERFAKPK